MTLPPAYKYAKEVITELGWTFSDDLQYINNEIAPLFVHHGLDGQENKAAIIINPEHKIISLEKEVNDGNPSLVYNRTYALEVRGDISGKSIINILAKIDFLSLIKSINTNWSLEWDGRNHVGELDEKTELELHDFSEWLSTADHETGIVGVADDDYFEPRFYDIENNEVDYDDEYENITSVLLLNLYIISPSIDEEMLVRQITEDLPSDTEIREIDKYVRQYYEHVCHTVMQKTNYELC